MKLHLLLAIVANAILIVSSDESSSEDTVESSRSFSSSSSCSSSRTSSTSTEDSSEEETCGDNERCVDCPDTLCQPETCDDLGYPQKCPILGPDGECPGKPDCVCIDNYVRNSEGICIPKEKCPTCGGDPNAVSGCGGNCGRLCSNYYKSNISCILICDLNGCDCKDNYVYDEIAEKCVLPEQCTNSCTKANEVFDPCPAPCPFRTCGIDDRVISCVPGPKVGDPNCPPPVCRCKDGYYRNGDGECVTWEECPTCSKPNEVYDICPAPCPPRKCGVNEALILCIVPPKPGDPECEPGCRCADGYVKNAYDVCIPKDECPKCTNPNEVFDPCPQLCPPRRCDVDERAIRCRAPPKLGDPECEPGCRCADGYVRNSVDICVTRDQCNVSVCNRPNEVFDLCPSDCPPRRCDADDRAIRCPAPPKIGDAECKPDCRCADGYVRNNKGDCVTRDQCPKCRRPNEAFHPCPPTCPPQTCDSLTKNIKCPVPYGFNGNNLVSHRCHPSCICQPGFYRNKIGECISKKDCLRCTGPHEYFSCGSACDNDCKDLYKQNQTNCQIKNIICNRKCYCEKGYARDVNNICIPISQCPAVSCAGDLNATPGCGINCGRRCDDYFKDDVVCPAVCYDDGCDCQEGYVYDGNINRCVRPKECTPVCGSNEVFSNCVNGGCDAKYCSQLGKPVPCVRPKYCIKGCLCKKGYLRAKDGTCVPEKKCPKPLICGKHEVYAECPPLLCQPLNCSQLGHPIPCPDIIGPGCPWDPACICEAGYLRDDDGVCIPEKQCSTCGGDPNAQAGCGVNCGRLCSNYDKDDVSCIQACFPNACDCKEGYVLDENINKCVRPKKCSSKCGPNEQYDPCPSSSCRAQNCSQLGYPLLNCSEPSNCTDKPACVCKDGYLRNDDGDCIPENECPSCGGDPNAQPGCGGYCGRRCSTYNKGPTACPAICYLNACDCKEGHIYDDNLQKCVRPEQCTPVCGNDEVYSECTNGGCQAKNCSQLGKPIPCIKIDPKYCKKGCLCKEGYLRLQNGTCVQVDECPQPQCGENEEYSECPSATCRPQKCDELGYPIPCPDAPQSGCTDTPACICKEGYVRNEENECIPQNLCPSCRGDPNARSGCGVYCNQRCSDYNREPGACILICYPNACDCKEGLFYDEITKKCVSPEECTPQCGKDEVYSECINGGCQAKNCSQVGKPIPCKKINPKYCIKGCLCKEDYLRLDNGTCVPADDCSPQCNQPNEVYDSCPYECPPQTCESLEKAYVCLVPVDRPCNPSCRCKTGYYRNKKNECISEENCLKCMGPHEYYSCGKACDNECYKLNRQNQTNCPIVNIECTEMCYCEEGFARNENKTCVPIEQCQVPQCGKNEIYSECPAFSCKLQNCSQAGYPVICPYITDINKCPTKPGCICKDGYLRNNHGICVPQKQCPSCGGDPNAQPGCGINCGRRCSNYNKKNVACPQICKVGGCDCKKGFVYDDNLKKCVRPKQCTQQCGNNEVYSTCIQGECRHQKCTQLGKSVACPRIDPKYCKKGCLCKEGYLRDNNGTCVPERNCPLNCTGPHEVFSCGSACDNECSMIHKQSRTNCPIVNIVCNNKCYCKNGYARDENKICIPIEDCKVPQCGENEEYEKCPSSLCRPQNCSQLGFPIDCSELPESDSCSEDPACVCKDGYVRSKKGKCIPKNKCPSCGDDPNAVSGCGVNCNKHCSDYNGKPRGCIKICRVNACDCKDDYYFDDNTGKCVKPKQCTPVCEKNEIYSTCIQGDCRPQNCTQLGQSVPCPRIDPKYCKKGCLCKEGYLRSKNGTCVPEEECPSICSNPNEVYDPCPPTCPPQTCDSLNHKYFCPFMPANKTDKNCSGECRCKPGYLRNKIGECISKKDCQPQCGENERLEECPSCVQSPQKCSELGYNISCKKSVCDDEEPGCICVDGYVRNKKGKCIPVKRCPSCGGDPNAEAGCGINCNKHCSDYNQEPRACIEICKTNACDCKPGYYYDDNIDECVLPKQCTPTCEDNEVYNTCVNGGCDMKNCSQLGEPTLCIDPIECEDGCICKRGYLRDDNGTCVPEDECYLCPETTTTTPPPTTTAPPITTTPEPNNGVALEDLQEGDVLFTGDFLYKKLLKNPGKNFVASPFSVLMPLGQLAYFSKGKTFDQIMAVLNLKTKQDILNAFSSLIKTYQTQEYVTLTLTSKVYSNKKYPLSSAFKNISKEYFASQGGNIDFGLPQQAAATINKWVEDDTNGKITNLVVPDMFNEDTRLALINAVYFLGNWIHQFNPNNTKLKDFHVSKNVTNQIPMMYQKNSFRYGENADLNSKILELRYKGGNFTCLVFLPDEDISLLSLVEKLRYSETYFKAIENLQYVEVQVSLPQFKIATETNLEEIFKETGLGELVNPKSNDITGVLEEDEPLYVSAAVQKAFIEVNEVGTEAAAANAVVVSTLSAVYPPPKEYIFNANRPYVLYIALNKIPLFCAVFAGA